MIRCWLYVWMTEVGGGYAFTVGSINQMVSTLGTSIFTDVILSNHHIPNKYLGGSTHRNYQNIRYMVDRGDSCWCTFSSPSGNSCFGNGYLFDHLVFGMVGFGIVNAM